MKQLIPIKQPISMRQLATAVLLLFLTGALLFTLLLPPRPLLAQRDEICSGSHQHVSLPLPTLGDQPYVRMDGQTTTFRGGLYPDGQNERPPAHEAAGQTIAAGLQPLDANGRPDAANGKIVMTSVGMSNTSSEFNTFIQYVHQDPLLNPQLVIVNGAQGGRTADRWSDPETDVWDNLNGALNHRRVTPAQVQTVWIKLTLTRGGEFPAKAEELQAHLVTILQELKSRYPNLQMVYLSSRTRSYTYERGLSPEPVAFETGFAVKWLIEQQINGDPALNYDPAAGAVRAPYLSWGPYLWIDGENPRSDGRVWLAADMIGDCTHPSADGNQKVAEMLYEFFLTDSTTGWFRAGFEPVAVASPVPSPTPTATSTNTPLSPTETAPPTATTTPTETPTNLPPTATTTPHQTSEPAAAVAANSTPTAADTAVPTTANQPQTTPPYIWPAVLGVGVLLGLGMGWLFFGRQRPS